VWYGRTSLAAALQKIECAEKSFNSILRKMWTGDRDLWQNLDELEKSGETPFFASIQMDYSGQYPKAYFISATSLGMRIPSEEEMDCLMTKLNLK